MNEEELNRKLAEWAGFEEQYNSGSYMNIEVAEYSWYDPKGNKCGILPDFTQSLDACFKWLVPKLFNPDDIFYRNPIVHIFFDTPSNVVVRLSVRDFESYQRAENPALALCLVIEKLIDEGREA
jgi:hypothetical protein